MSVWKRECFVFSRSRLAIGVLPCRSTWSPLACDDAGAEETGDPAATSMLFRQVLRGH